METIVIVLTPCGPIIGQFDVDAHTVTKPRALSVVPDGRGRAQISVSELVGGAASLALTGECFWYTPTDKNILNAYIQSTTGIQIAGSLPAAPRPN